MKCTSILVVVLALYSISLTGCQTEAEGTPTHEERKIVVTSAQTKDVVLTQEYVCQIHSRRHIEVCALEGGYLERIPIKEGQRVKEGDVLFRILPPLYKAKWEAEKAEVQTAQVELKQSRELFQKRMVSQVDVTLHEAQLAKAQADAQLAEAEYNFSFIKAPFDGIVDRLYEQQGSLVEEGEMLTNLSDNSVMWVYFNVPEARYLEYMAAQNQTDNSAADAAAESVDDQDDEDADRDAHKVVQSQQIELVLANGNKFPQPGKIGAIEAKFNNETGNIPFRADFPNPNGLLRHGQTGTVLLHRTLQGALVIPQRAVFEILEKQFVWVVGQDGVVHPREIVVENELEDIFVIKSGLNTSDRFVIDGVQQVHDGLHVKPEFQEPEEVLANLKYHAE